MNVEEVVNRVVIQSDGCFSWAGAHDGKGYPHFAIGGKGLRVMRVLYTRFVGSIPRGFLLHHLCEHKWCVNPFHVQPVTKLDHDSLLHPRARKTHCVRGHELTEDNILIQSRSDRPQRWRRRCKQCDRERKR